MIPCLEPVLMIIAWFSWCTINGTKVCCTLMTLQIKHDAETSFAPHNQSTHPKRLTSKTLCQASMPSQDVPRAPTPALFMSTAT